MYTKVSEATRLYWVCQLFGHWFRWRSYIGDICHTTGECRICKARRNFDVVWPRPVRTAK